MRASDISVGGDANQVAKIEEENRALVAAEAVKAESGGSVEEPGNELGSVQQEARTCSVCGTKFSAAGDSDFCPVYILPGASVEYTTRLSNNAIDAGCCYCVSRTQGPVLGVPLPYW